MEAEAATEAESPGAWSEFAEPPVETPEPVPAAGWLGSSPDPEPPAAPPEAGADAQYTIPGWVAPPPDPVPEGAGWLGEALAASAPLSDAEVGTLRSAGIEPSDGAGALRLLAGLLRSLERRGILDVSEIADDVRAARSLSEPPASSELSADVPAADSDRSG
ncbi:MAG: hypothetical protein NVS2B9_19760 [Myxococcales bacterium]